MTTASQAPYRFAAEKCDVQDHAKLLAFREKRAEWVALLEQNPLHSVSRQLSSLVWQDAVFRLFHEANRLGNRGPSTASHAPLLVEALTNGYVVGLVLGVSRLTDPKNDTKKGDRNVVSLRRVFEDIRDHCHLITREVFVCYDGLVYDVNTIPPPSHRIDGEAAGLAVGGPRDTITPTMLHEHFDRLSGVPAAARRRDDVIADWAFDEIESLLALPVVEKLRTLRNKVIAHAADPASRATVQNFGFSLDEARLVLHALCRAYELVQINLLWNSSGNVMPIPQFDIMEHMDQPFLKPSHIEALMPFWQELISEREQWRTTSPSPTGFSQAASPHSTVVRQ
jgi:hypothetical protein